MPQSVSYLQRVPKDYPDGDRTIPSLRNRLDNVWVIRRMLAANPFNLSRLALPANSSPFTTAQRAIELQERMEIAKLTTEAKRDRIYNA